MTAAHIAVHRFGLGAEPGAPLPRDARGWVLSQLPDYRPRPAAWASVPGTDALWERHLEIQRRLKAEPNTSPERTAAQRDNLEIRRSAFAAAAVARFQSAVDTPAPFAERLVHFWSNHFAVSVEKVPVLLLAGAYEGEAIRPHVLGRFEDMLVAVARHPAMLLYLDQSASMGPDSPSGQIVAARYPDRKRGLNENLAREILELHTLGVNGGYSQADVLELARALTGWSVLGDRHGREDQLVDGAPRFVYRPRVHQPGPRTLLGRRYAEGHQEQALEMLRTLATAPATAKHVSFKLARHFVADEPPAALVDRMAATFLKTGGDLKSVYRTLVESPEPWAAERTKFKTPWEWMVSANRGLGLPPPDARVIASTLNELGQPLWQPRSPAGFDDVAASWAAPDALVRRAEVAQRLAARVPSGIEPMQLLATTEEPGRPSRTTDVIARADSRATGVALWLVSPGFLRR